MGFSRFFVPLCQVDFACSRGLEDFGGVGVQGGGGGYRRKFYCKQDFPSQSTSKKYYQQLHNNDTVSLLGFALHGCVGGGQVSNLALAPFCLLVLRNARRHLPAE